MPAASLAAFVASLLEQTIMSDIFELPPNPDHRDLHLATSPRFYDFPFNDFQLFVFPGA
jgi:hypothetical protein